MPKKNLDIILPCYNPAENWEEKIVSAVKILEDKILNYDLNIIVVNDGSSQGFSKNEIQYLKKELNSFEFINNKENKGKGSAIREGFLKSKSDFAVFTDIDFPYQELNLLAMINELEKGSDIVIGTRDNEYYKKVPIIRKFISKFFKRLIRFIFRIPTSDTQAGLKAFSQKGKLVILETKINRYLFDLELVKRAYKQNLKFGFVNLDLKENIVLSKMPISILLSELKNLFKILFI